VRRFGSPCVSTAVAMQNYAVTTHGTVATRSVVDRNFVPGGSTNSVEDRENVDLGAVAP